MRTAELHLALATPTEDKKFATEPFTLLYQRSLYHSMRTLTRRVFEMLHKNAKKLNEPLRADVDEVLKLEKAMIDRFALPPEMLNELGHWADLWYSYVAATYLKACLKGVGSAPFIPTDAKELELMLDAYMLEKAIYEVGYELNNRPDWLTIPLRGIKFLMEK